MILRLVPDQPRLKLALRYTKAVHRLLVILGVSELPEDIEKIPAPRGADRKDFLASRKVYLETREAAESIVPAGALDSHLGVNVAVKLLTKVFKVEVEVPSEVVETAKHEGFTVEVHELTGMTKLCKFMPLVLKDGKVVRRIFVRSKTAYVSLEHFAKRAIDQFVATGKWPAKLGVTISARQPEG